MTPDHITDSEFQMLAGLAEGIRGEYIREGAIDPWIGSPFAWIKALPPATKGRVGEQLVTGWCGAMGIDVIRSPDADADRIIGGQRMEIKFSMLWQSGIYKFQQIRNQNYEYITCLGIAPFQASCWIVPKAFLLEHAPIQHGGSRGSDTRWLFFPAANPPEWLSPYGGSLDQAANVLKAIQQPSSV